jgi:hypothetical protein
LKENLLDDPDLLDDEIWRIFDMAPVRGAILVGTDITAVADGTGRGPNEAGSWGYVLRDFSREGKLDRQRLLAASLTAILRNSKGSNTVWFCRFHELLEPTPEERLSLEGPYLQLLSHPFPAVADFAIDALRILAKDNRLDFDKLIDAITPVFRLEPKAQPLAALKLLAGSKTSDGRFSHKLATAVIPGLGHPAPQVQAAILQFLHKLGNGEDEVISYLLQQHFEMLAPSVREKARQMIALPAESPPTVTPSEGSSSAELLEEARKLPSPWRKGAGIDALLHAIESNGDLPALTFDPMSIPRLHDDQRVQPIQTLEELIERLTIAIEDLNDPIEFELLLEGLS